MEGRGRKKKGERKKEEGERKGEGGEKRADGRKGKSVSKYLSIVVKTEKDNFKTL